ncbi:uncharacterized protein AB675_11270 [Cyphellophora attinorum]|uniref:Uncharacterized protein n=1 Tax=Cyphellophora attinorum TaxID=1664694 RepID=A0A0N1H9H9_9EURO|nr:uncharacterized protein AB675_11270 [Phialophora attinorum]KPI40210.1 hypothetical protein AB675_11270 [Phialophora attinorum]
MPQDYFLQRVFSALFSFAGEKLDEPRETTTSAPRSSTSSYRPPYVEDVPDVAFSEESKVDSLPAFYPAVIVPATPDHKDTYWQIPPAPSGRNSMEGFVQRPRARTDSRSKKRHISAEYDEREPPEEMLFTLDELDERKRNKGGVLVFD